MVKGVKPLLEIFQAKTIKIVYGKGSKAFTPFTATKFLRNKKREHAHLRFPRLKKFYVYKKFNGFLLLFLLNTLQQNNFYLTLVLINPYKLHKHF